MSRTKRWRIVLSMRTDENNNPTAFTTDLARQAGLRLGIDYELGTKFPGDSTLITARILGDPIEVTIRLIDKVGYRTKAGRPRWDYICLPKWLWDELSMAQRVDVIGDHYLHEGGTAMKGLFPNYGKA